MIDYIANSIQPIVPVLIASGFLQSLLALSLIHIWRKRMKGFWTKYRGQLLATVVLLLLVAAAPMQTYYEREFTCLLYTSCLPQASAIS